MQEGWLADAVRFVNCGLDYIVRQWRRTSCRDDANSLIASTPASSSCLAAADACAAAAISGTGTFIQPIIWTTMSGGSAFVGTIPSPVEKILGPGTAPESIRSRRRRVFCQLELRSNAVVNPYLVSMSCICRSNSATGDFRRIRPFSFSEMNMAVPESGHDRLNTRAIEEWCVRRNRRVGSASHGRDLSVVNEHDSIVKSLIGRSGVDCRSGERQTRHTNLA